MNYDKYIKYKNKYFQLKKYNLIGGNTQKTYQEIIYDIAKFLKPHMLNKFKHEYGLKQLSNQVIELNKVLYLTTLQNTITNYYITDKIDGLRTLLYLTNSKSYTVSDVLDSIDITVDDICILDTEKYNNDYYIFDVIVFNGKSLLEEPFEERMKYFSKFQNIKNIKIKPFIRLTTNYREQITEFKNDKSKPYHVDGIILTPYDGHYNTMKVYKYKPPDQLTIDFLIKKYPDNLLEDLKYKINKNKTLYVLFCGISKDIFYKLRMNLIDNYQSFFPNIDINHLPKYFPIQFEPSSHKNIYFFWSDNTKLDGEVGEFLFNIHLKEWDLKKIRYDRKNDVQRGNYFGNNYKTTESIWMALSDPLIIENIKEEPNVYFQEHNNILQKASRNFNSYVKTEILKKFKNTEWVMDLASGKGQDLFRYSMCGMKNIIFLEIDKLALTELITRKHLFSFDKKYPNRMNILIQNIDLLDSYKDNIKKIDNIYTSQNIDLIVCNFAFHYLIKDMDSLQNICKFINHYLKQNGTFIFTAFDGNKIFNLLNKNNGKWIIKVNNQIKYGIKKKYNSNKLEPIGQKIEVLLPFSKNTFYEEYLININTIIKEFSKYNIVLLKNNSFSYFINSYKGNMDKDDKTYVDLYHYYIFTKK